MTARPEQEMLRFFRAQKGRYYNMKKSYELTEEQKIFAEKNHALVEEFIGKKRLNRSDFYDVVVFGYLDAVKSYLEKPELSKYCFRSIAWVKMKECMQKEYIYLYRPKRKAPRGMYHEDYDTLFQNQQIADRAGHVSENWDNRLQIQQLMLYIKPKEREVLYMRAAGYTYREIAESCNISIRAVSLRLERMRQRLRSLALM